MLINKATTAGNLLFKLTMRHHLRSAHLMPVQLRLFSKTDQFSKVKQQDD